MVQSPLGHSFIELSQLVRLATSIESPLANTTHLLPLIVATPHARPRAEAFEVRQRVIFDNDASSRYTVIEVNARDRPALLNRLARTLFEAGLMVHSAHIATYGERAADTFYVTDALGDKVTSTSRLQDIEKALLDATNENLVPAKGKKAGAA